MVSRASGPGSAMPWRLTIKSHVSSQNARLIPCRVTRLKPWQAEPGRADGLARGAVLDRQMGQALVLMHCERSARGPSLRLQARWPCHVRPLRPGSLRSPARRSCTIRCWRMQLALAWFEEQRMGITETASRLGYRSEAPFKRAFRRNLGVATGGGGRRSNALRFGN